MPKAGFPVVKQIGLFKLDTSPVPVWLYEVQQLIGHPLCRSCGVPRGLNLVQEGWSYHITAPPKPNNGGLCFVAVMLHPMGTSGSNLPSWLGHRIYNVLQVMSMQYQGYLYRANTQACIFEIVFPDTVNALFCCHSSQLALMVESWPSDTASLFGPTQDGLDGKLLWAGPRCAMAIHKTSDFKEVRLPHPAWHDRMSCLPSCYYGSGVDFTAAVAAAAQGGQVVCTEPAWSEVHYTLPGGRLALLQCLHLGVHEVSNTFTAPVSLMEVMPAPISRRDFKKLNSCKMLSPGFRDSPDPEHDMAIVFVSVSKPHEVFEAQQMTATFSDDHIMSVITLFEQQLTMVGEILRSTLTQFNGYECKNPEAGKFTLAFSCLADALRCCVALQLRLVSTDWPDEVLQWDECKTVKGRHNMVVWRGLRLRMGCAYGKPDHRKPLHTGRADYYGSLPNLAARVCALAKPGQLLVEASCTQQFSGLSFDSISAKYSPRSHTFRGTSRHMVHKTRVLGNPGTLDTIELRPLGPFKMKGFDDEQWIYCAFPPQFSDRYPPAHAPTCTVSPHDRLGRDGSFRHMFKTWSGWKSATRKLARLRSLTDKEQDAEFMLMDSGKSIAAREYRNSSLSAVAQIQALQLRMAAKSQLCTTQDVGEVGRRDIFLDRCLSLDLGAVSLAHQRICQSQNAAASAGPESPRLSPNFSAVSHLSAADAMSVMRRVDSCPAMMLYSNTEECNPWRDADDEQGSGAEAVPHLSLHVTSSAPAASLAVPPPSVAVASPPGSQRRGQLCHSMDRPADVAQRMMDMEQNNGSPAHATSPLTQRTSSALTPEAGDSYRSGRSALEALTAAQYSWVRDTTQSGDAATLCSPNDVTQQDDDALKSPFDAFSGVVERSAVSVRTAEAQQLASAYVLTRRATLKFASSLQPPDGRSRAHDVLRVDDSTKGHIDMAGLGCEDDADSPLSCSVMMWDAEEWEYHPARHCIATRVSSIQSTASRRSSSSKGAAFKGNAELDGVGVRVGTAVQKTRQLFRPIKALHLPPSFFVGDVAGPWDDKEQK